MTRLTPIRSALACVALAALAATGLSACKGSANNAKTGGGTLTIQGDAGNPTLVENFNPLVTATELGGARLIYEPLEIASPIDGSYTPFLATGYKFTDPKTLVYAIRQGVKWSDGKAFTSADVVFTLQMLKKFPALDGNGLWSQITNVATSGNDVTVTFKDPNVPFAAVVAATPIVPQHIWSTVADPVKYANTKPVGTGPFTLDKFAPTQYTLKKNASYWQADKIAPKAVVFPAQSSNQSTNQLDVTSGKFDWAYNFLPDVKKTYVARDPKHNIYWFPPGGAIGLYLNLTKAPYSDVNFRKGVSLSLNRTTIATKAVNGYLDQASMSGLILPNLDKWLDPNLADKGVVSQNASAAKAAFAQAGYTSQGGKLVKDGKQSIQSGKFDAAIGGYGGTGTPYTDFNNALSSSFAAPVGTATANNFERFKDPAVDSALSTLAAATDESAQKQATSQLEQIIYNQVPVVLMYYGGSWGLFSTKNFTGWPSAKDPYTLPTSYNNAVLVVVTHLKKA